MANKECEKIIRQIPLYIDNMLSDSERDEVSSHIAKCPECKSEYDYLKAIMINTAKLPPKELPKDFCEKVMARIKKEKKIPRRVLLYRIGAYAAAAAVIALSFVAFGQLDDNSEKSEIKEQYITSKVSEAPISKEATKKETAKPERQKPIKTEESKTEITKEEQIPASISLEEEMTTYKTITVTLTDDNRNAVSEILSAYEKDETGYIAEDIESVAEKLKEAGASVIIDNNNTNAHNYIIIK